MKPIREKIAVITGAGRGNGRAIATALAAKGAHVGIDCCAVKTEQKSFCKRCLHLVNKSIIHLIPYPIATGSYFLIPILP